MSDTEKYIKDGIGAAIGLIPYVGGPLAFVLNLVWPIDEDPVADPWLRVKDRVEAAIDAKFDERDLEDIKAALDGLRMVSGRYAADFANNDSGVSATFVAAELDYASRYADFMPETNPRKAQLLLPWMAQFATLHLTLLREAVHYGKSWGKEDKWVSTRHDHLKEGIDRYCKWIDRHLPRFDREKPTDLDAWEQTNTKINFFTLNVADLRFAWPYMDPDRHPYGPIKPRPDRELFLRACDFTARSTNDQLMWSNDRRSNLVSQLDALATAIPRQEIDGYMLMLLTDFGALTSTAMNHCDTPAVYTEVCRGMDDNLKRRQQLGREHIGDSIYGLYMEFNELDKYIRTQMETRGLHIVPSVNGKLRGITARGNNPGPEVFRPTNVLQKFDEEWVDATGHILPKRATPVNEKVYEFGPSEWLTGAITYLGRFPHLQQFMVADSLSGDDQLIGLLLHGVGLPRVWWPQKQLVSIDEKWRPPFRTVPIRMIDHVISSIYFPDESGIPIIGFRFKESYSTPSR
ncbi:MAG: insecticidal delta-endotoxin Cry8Ea1 family protein [Acidimicrobiales bacterium]